MRNRGVKDRSTSQWVGRVSSTVGSVSSCTTTPVSTLVLRDSPDRDVGGKSTGQELSSIFVTQSFQRFRVHLSKDILVRTESTSTGTWDLRSTVGVRSSVVDRCGRRIPNPTLEGTKGTGHQSEHETKEKGKGRKEGDRPVEPATQDFDEVGVHGMVGASITRTVPRRVRLGSGRSRLFLPLRVRLSYEV